MKTYGLLILIIAMMTASFGFGGVVGHAAYLAQNVCFLASVGLAIFLVTTALPGISGRYIK